MLQHYPFTLMPLPYSYDALEPYIDMETLYYHHDMHLATYVNNLNAALAPYPEYHDWPLKKLLTNLSELPDKLKIPVTRNAGGVFNHEFYFSMMSPKRIPIHAEMIKKLEDSFQSLDSFTSQLKEAALSVFGSGYAWLVYKNNQLVITTTPNQDCPVSAGQLPLLCIDVWEHAYYLKNQNRRADYFGFWWEVINWQQVETLLSAAQQT